MSLVRTYLLVARRTRRRRGLRSDGTCLGSFSIVEPARECGAAKDSPADLTASFVTAVPRQIPPPLPQRYLQDQGLQEVKYSIMPPKAPRPGQFPKRPKETDATAVVASAAVASAEVASAAVASAAVDSLADDIAELSIEGTLVV